MLRTAERIALLIVDGCALVGALLAYPLIWIGITGGGPPSFTPTEMIGGVPAVCLYWLALFFFAGLYRGRYAASRFDEFATLFKVVSLGTLGLFFLLLGDIGAAASPRLSVLLYWGCTLGTVGGGRLVVRTVQKYRILQGHGMHRALVVGWDDRVEELYGEIQQYPAAGLDVVDRVHLRRVGASTSAVSGDLVEAAGSVQWTSETGDGSSYEAVPEPEGDRVPVDELPGLIDELDVQDVLIAVGPEDHESLMALLRHCDGNSVSLKIVPDFYTIIGGMARSEHMYGVPLIEVLPEPMRAWEESTKRLVDVLVSSAILVAGIPLWAAVAAAVRLTSRGPVIYRQERVGRAGELFTIYKFRTMERNAEAETGPVWASEDDPRYTSIGAWLRRMRLDEIPQLWNVLKGDMSLVGPRPERPYFVERLVDEVPLYNRRHRVKPGITGLAQVKWKYDATVEDVRQKVKYDLFYIENMSLRLDAKILFQTVKTALGFNGR